MDDMCAAARKLFDDILNGDGVEEGATGVFCVDPFDHVESGFESSGAS